MTDETTPTESLSSRSKLPVIVFGLALSAWMLFLATLTLTARPVVVNQRQVRRADLLVTATLAEPGKNQVHIKEVIRGTKPDADVADVPNLNLVRMEKDTPYIVPLWRDGRIVKVSKLRDPASGRPMIYPDTPDVRQQIRDAMELGIIVE